jgi:uncharacterized protein (DUF111 family)
MPAMTVGQIGYGAGTADPGIPNLLRVAIGEARDDIGDYEVEQTVLIETNIDDMNPQLYDYLMGRLLSEGALDVFLTAVQMKKNRPGTLLSVICRSDVVGHLADILMQETTTIGLRWRVENRIMAVREIRCIETMHGPVDIKLARSNGRIINLTPEYDDCKRVALEKRLPLKKVLDDVRTAALREVQGGDASHAASD